MLISIIRLSFLICKCLSIHVNHCTHMRNEAMKNLLPGSRGMLDIYQSSLQKKHILEGIAN